MASELHVDAIKHSGGTSALTINSSGVVHMAGHVIQVVSATSTTRAAITSSSFTAFDLNCDITPKFSSSKILIHLQSGFNSEAADRRIDATIYRTISGGSATELSGQTNGFQTMDHSGNRNEGAFSIHYLDSPSTTTSTNYKLYCRSVDSATIEIPSSNTQVQSIVLMEVAQ
tara:strand:+ start:913 stop:1428 length:516 start_codon:yes stop_codon:yes gene_type:complete